MMKFISRNEITEVMIYKLDSLYRILKNIIYYGCFAYFGVELKDHSPTIIDKVLWEQQTLKSNNQKY